MLKGRCFMRLIDPVLKIIRAKRTLFLQIVFVALSFLMMVVSSTIIVRGILNRHLIKQAESLLSLTRLKIEAELAEPQTALTVIAGTIRSMILSGSGSDDVQKFMRDAIEELQRKEIGVNFQSVYGYFDVFQGQLLYSDGWTGGPGSDITQQSRHKAAADDKIVVTPMYMNARLDEYFVTYAMGIFGDEGIFLGTVCLEVPLDHIRDYITGMQIIQGGYGVLLNEDMVFIAHPNETFIGHSTAEIESWIDLSVDLESGLDIFQKEFRNYFGTRIIAFSAHLENNWVLTLMTPKDSYFRELGNMIMIISSLGLIFAAVLIIILIGIDIDRVRKDAKFSEMEKMREADELTQLMLDSMPLGCKLWNRNMELIHCNEALLRLFELTDKEIFFRRFFDFSPEYQPCGRKSQEMAVEVVRKAFDSGYERFEWIHQTLAGSPIPAEITLVRLRHNGDYAVAGYIRDLRQYRQMMQKIEKRDSLLDTVNRAAAMLLETAEADRMNDSIMAGMELLGSSVGVDRVQIWQSETIDGELYAVRKYEWRSEFGKRKINVSPLLKIPYREISEWEEKLMDGEYISSPMNELPSKYQKLLGPFDIKSILIIPLFMQDKFWGFFSLEDCRSERIFSEEEIKILQSGGLLVSNAFLRSDMTQNLRNSAERLEAALKDAQEANQAKSKFLATMSHEIRTPMNVILGVTESQLLDDKLLPEQRENYGKIYDSGSLLLSIINDILDLSKIEAGKFELISAKYNVLSLINDTANMCLMQYGHKQLKFKLHVDENIPVHLFGDELRIKQVAYNMLSNAFKYTNAGEVNLSFNAEDTTETAVVLRISVRDTGQGMTPEQIAKIFDEYSRFNLEANRTTVGTGLGMAITRNLVKMMNGRILVESVPEKGTTITVLIPQQIAAPGLLGKEAADNIQNFKFSSQTRGRAAKIVRESMPYGKVLVVDDMKSNLDVARMLLKPYKISVDTAESGFEAVDKIANGGVYDIVFMDHMMPKMDGLETTGKIRALGYTNPIIALTANAVTGQQEIFMSSGFDGYISKPIDLRQLNDSLNKHVRDRHLGHSEPAAVEAEEIPGKSLPEGEALNTVEINIQGVDADKCFELFYSGADMLISVLRSYVPNALDNIEKMKNFSPVAIKDYTVYVHGLKSISANICADEICEAAYRLEMASKNEDIDAVTAGNEPLINEVKKLTERIQSWLDNYDKTKTRPVLERPDRDLLKRLQKFCLANDTVGIQEAMAVLESSDYASEASLITWLRGTIDESDFSLAAQWLSAYVDA
jgi:signal transduction histidine kinase/FixJ family two-component response regulator/PAS domain-containing protein/HPt (histidine-containing phosphotransfer) domain-containing protein